MRRTLIRLVPPLVALAVGAALAPACGNQCDRNPDEPPVPWKGGDTDLVRMTYESAPLGGPFLDFPPGRTYRFFHGLHGVPRLVKANISFAEFPTGEGTDSEGFVDPAGNQVTYEAVTDEYVDVRNDTCSDVRIRLYAADPEVATTDAGISPASDAGP
ncbi:MAG TPA: hypothetical protein VHE30_06790 [Polyangiaceae bacterium]|nr:hypothetical protein [Polyangiaceae bacterium]